MENVRRYSIDGFELVVPVYRDDFSGKLLEDYSKWLDSDRYTTAGHLIRCSPLDACEYGESADDKPCVECAACRFYKRAAPHTWIGVCKHEKRMAL